MTCPVCGGATLVLDSASDCDSIYRKRKCKDCDHRFYTIEIEGDDNEIKNILYQLRESKRA